MASRWLLVPNRAQHFHGGRLRCNFEATTREKVAPDQQISDRAERAVLSIVEKTSEWSGGKAIASSVRQL